MSRPYVRRRDRVVKGRTAKQREAAQRYSAAQPSSASVDAAPKTSWWIGKTRAQLQAAIAEEQLRMRHSRLGQMSDPKFSI